VRSLPACVPMNSPLAYFDGDFRPASELTLSIEDLGVLQGVAVSERLRTFRGTLFHLQDHLQRLDNSLKVIGVSLELSLERIGQIAEQLISTNSKLLAADDDLGLSIFATPGIATVTRSTLGIHTCPLPFGQWASYYAQGQAITETGIRQVPASCWPPELKCRSRMHYYLADRRAHQMRPGSRAILLDDKGFVSEASTANIVFYRESEGLVSPPLDKILPGVSLSVLVEIAAQLGIPVRYRDFGLDELETADEILLCSTSPCVWPVTEVNGRAAGGGPDGPLVRRLLTTWSELVGLDIVAQAQRFSWRR